MAKSQRRPRWMSPNSAQNQRRAKAARGRLGTGASGMLPELGVWDKNSANGMAGAIASTTVLDTMTTVRSKSGINMACPAQLQLKTRSQVEDCSWQDATGHENRTWRCLSLSKDSVSLNGKRICQSERLAASWAGDRAGGNVEEGVSYPAPLAFRG